LKWEINELIGLDSSVYSPSLSINTTFPFSAIDKSCFLVIRLYTIEFFSRNIELIGTAIQHLFYDTTTKEQPTSISLLKNISLNPGAFQIPIYSDRLGSKFFRMETDVGKVIRVPCTTILLRVSVGDALSSSPPLYQQGRCESNLKTCVGGYQSMPMDAATDAELLIYHFVFEERMGYSARDRLLSLGDAIPKTARHTESTLLEWLERKTNFQLDKKNKMDIREIDLRFLDSVCLLDIVL
jgi:hypothetical protein